MRLLFVAILLMILWPAPGLPVDLEIKSDFEIVYRFFSGRENPKWLVHKDSEEFIKVNTLLTQVRSSSPIPSPTRPNHFGYTGFAIQAKNTTESAALTNNLNSYLEIYNGIICFHSLVQADKWHEACYPDSVNLEKTLLKKAKLIGIVR